MQSRKCLFIFQGISFYSRFCAIIHYVMHFEVKFQYELLNVPKETISNRKHHKWICTRVTICLRLTTILLFALLITIKIIRITNSILDTLVTIDDTTFLIIKETQRWRTQVLLQKQRLLDLALGQHQFMRCRQLCYCSQVPA